MRRFLSDAIATNPAAPVGAVLGLIGLAYAVQLSMPLNHDVSWLLLATGRLLDGADVFLDDVIEVNPPLLPFLLMTAAQPTEPGDTRASKATG